MNLKQVFGCLLAGMALVGCGPLTFTVGVSPADQKLTHTVVEADGRWGSDRVAIVDLSGLIFNANRPGLLSAGENPVSLLHEKLQAAEQDRRVKAVILRLNSPGGTVNASDIMHRQIRRFKQRTGKPVVVLMQDVAASGGYYVACAGDYLIASPTSITGSIGVLLQTISIKPALTRWGVVTEAITSGPNKDAGSLLSTLTEEHRAILQGVVDSFYQRFVQVVREARPGIAPERFAALTDGRILTGEEAVNAGLVDQAGDLDDAFVKARSLAGLPHADFVLYHRPLRYVGSPYALGSGQVPSGTEVNLVQLQLPETFADQAVGFYYLWQPIQP